MRGALILVVCSTIAAAQVIKNFDEVEQDNHVWLINFANTGKNSQKFAPQWSELSGSLKRLETGSVDLQSQLGKDLVSKFKIHMAKIPFVALFKFVAQAEEPSYVTPIMEGSIATTKVLKKRLKRALKDLEKSDSGKFLKSADVPEVVKEYKQARASHILVKTEEECQALKERIAAGEKFADVAKKYSNCPSREKGGDLEWFGKGMMAAPFEQVCFYQSVNEVHGPVKTQFGWHLILITDRK